MTIEYEGKVITERQVLPAPLQRAVAQEVIIVELDPDPHNHGFDFVRGSVMGTNGVEEPFFRSGPMINADSRLRDLGIRWEQTQQGV